MLCMQLYISFRNSEDTSEGRHGFRNHSTHEVVKSGRLGNKVTQGVVFMVRLQESENNPGNCGFSFA